MQRPRMRNRRSLWSGSRMIISKDTKFNEVEDFFEGWPPLSVNPVVCYCKKCWENCAGYLPHSDGRSCAFALTANNNMQCTNRRCLHNQDWCFRAGREPWSPHLIQQTTTINSRFLVRQPQAPTPDLIIQVSAQQALSVRIDRWYLRGATESLLG